MASTRSTCAVLLCMLTLSSCAKAADLTEATSAEPLTTVGPTTTAGPKAPGGPIGSGSDGTAPGGPIGDGSEDNTALASPITIPAIQQGGQPVDDSEIYPGGVIGFVENEIRRQCPDGTLCGFTVTAIRQEPDPAPESSAVRDYCALITTEAQANPVIVTHPVDIPLNCVWRYQEPDTTAPDPEPDTSEPDTTEPVPETSSETTTTGPAE